MQSGYCGVYRISERCIKDIMLSGVSAGSGGGAGDVGEVVDEFAGDVGFGCGG
jgi:hypothetical protein